MPTGDRSAKPSRDFSGSRSSAPGISRVVLVHGLWFRSWAMWRVGAQLRRANFQTVGFSYSTTHQDLQRQVDKLFRFARLPGGELPHFVAHSMGGLITLQMLIQHREIPSGRIVLLGSPIQGSAVAQRLSELPGGRIALGEAERTLIRGMDDWPAERDIGMIAGTRAFGLGALAGGARSPGDGTVLASESRHEALDDHIEMPVTHTSMLLSGKVARQTISFLRNGRFDHE